MQAPTSPPPTAARSNKKRLVMHMEFFWGTVTEVLFDNWPGTKGTAQYVLSLGFVFVLALLLEWISRVRIAKTSPGALGRLLRVVVYTVRVGLANLVMLAVMSFNGGVFLAVVAGHALGFVIFAGDGAESGKPEPSGLHC